MTESEPRGQHHAETLPPQLLQWCPALCEQEPQRSGRRAMVREQTKVRKKLK